jgi:glyoxylase-like metal-dependent hydrolase (beta-lactamase superfamily II)
MTEAIKIGNVEITCVLDMIPPPRPTSAMFPDVSDDQWKDHQSSLENGQLQLYYNAFVLKSMDQLMMIDTGMGPGPHPDRGNITGNLYEAIRPVLAPPDNTQNTNVSPSDQVDFVIHTHLHADHVGWNLKYQGGMPAPSFRRARYLVPKEDYDYFSDPERLESFPHIQRQVMPLRRLRLQEIVEGDYQINEEIITKPTPGHTPGHRVVFIDSAGQKGVVVGDVLHSIAQVSEPSWCAGVDIDKEASAKNRIALLEQAEKEDMIVCAGHFPPGQVFGKVKTIDGRRTWNPVN